MTGTVIVVMMTGDCGVVVPAVEQREDGRLPMLGKGGLLQGDGVGQQMQNRIAQHRPGCQSEKKMHFLAMHILVGKRDESSNE